MHLCMPYNPETNPIELIFSPLKSKIKSTKNNHTIKHINNILSNFFGNFKKETLAGYYRHALNKL